MARLSQIVAHIYPAARPAIDYCIVSNVDAASEYISFWDASALGPQPTVAELETHRAATQAAIDAVTSDEESEKTAMALIIAIADDMINGTGTTAQRQQRVEQSLGRLIKRLAKNGTIP